MISYFQKLKNNKRPVSPQAGMTYVELIVVLGIFAIMSNIVLFSYQTFQAKVDIKNLINDIALKIVEAQKAASSGILPPSGKLSLISSSWKPSYGIYINRAQDNKSFIYFVDINNNNLYDDSDCTEECLDKINITKGNSISSLDVFYQGSNTPVSLNNVTLTFVRPDVGAVIRSASSLDPGIAYVQITAISPQSVTAKIKLYPSGRIQIN